MNNRLKLLHLTASLHIGGAERIILSLAEKMDRTQFETHVCVLGKFDDHSFLPEFQKVGVKLHVIPIKRFYSPRGLWETMRYLRRHQFDILHTHLTDADIVGRVAGWLTNTSVISTLHNTPFNYNNQRFDRRWLLRATARLFPSHFVGVSDQISDLFMKEWRIPRERISTIHNATPLEDFLSIPVGTAVSTAPDDKSGASMVTITNIGSLTPQKAQHLLLEAAQIVLQQRPNTRFFITGVGPLEQQLKAQAQELGIADQVVFTGLVRDIPKLLGQTDIFILPSLWEGLPISVIEAMAAARPIVVTDVGGNRELFESGVGGIIVPPGDVPALAHALLSLIDDKPLRLAMGQNARQRAEATFSFDRFAHAYASLYQRVAASNGRLFTAAATAKEEVKI